MLMYINRKCEIFISVIGSAEESIAVPCNTMNYFERSHENAVAVRHKLDFYAYRP